MRRSCSLVRFMVGVLLVCGLQVKAETDRPTDKEIQEMVTDLGVASDERRQAAVQKLTTWTEAYPRWMLMKLGDVYRDTEDIEVELTLRDILKPLVYQYVLIEEQGYLGVQHNAGRGAGEEGVTLEQVVAGTPASRAGLQSGDLVVSMGGKSFKELGGTDNFALEIARRKPGTLLEMGVVRNRKIFQVRVYLGAREYNRTLDRIREDDPPRTFEEWLIRMRPQQMVNGIPAGHFPVGAPEASPEKTPSREDAPPPE